MISITHGLIKHHHIKQCLWYKLMKTKEDGEKLSNKEEPL